MSKKICFVVVVIMLSFGLSTAYGVDVGNEKVSVLQKIKNAYNDSKNRQQQKTQVVKNEAAEQLPAPKVTVTKIEVPKVEPPQDVAPKVAALKIESPVIEPQKAVAPKDQPKDKEMTKEETIVNLKEYFYDNEEVLGAIPGLKASADRNGNVAYTYKDMELDKLSKDELSSLYIRVRQNMVRLRTERIERQLDTVRRIERIQAVTTPPQPPQSVRAPSVPPSVPRAPSAPRAPSSPPQAPQRR